MSKNLVIVESPTKARTISRFLGKDFIVESSYGHVRDLPKSKLGVDVENDFEPQYLIPVKSRPTVKKIKADAAKVRKVILATDEDREGEAIAWHLAQALDLDTSKKTKSIKSKTVERIVFHEITKRAIEDALKHPREIDQKLVDAQQTRRILDRLVGYKLSPFLWKKFYRGLSAGRVQSVAMRLVVEREREVEKFKPEEYYSLAAELERKEENFKFEALLAKINGNALDKLELKTKEGVDGIIKTLENADWTVEKAERRAVSKNPLPPFTTSTLQQTAFQRLGFSAKQTMRLAQQLYEGIELGEGHVGLITYMRTDSLNLSEDSLREAQSCIRQNFGEKYALDSPRRFKTKTKGAQEAHEAIRPADPSRHPDSIKNFLDARQFKLYNLIWRRFIATQMPAAILESTTAEIDACPKNRAPGESFTFRASGQTLKFDGFLKAYPSKITETELPELKIGECLKLLELKPAQHFTEPPPRYSEASLIKSLEKYGIGRPSTYAPTISTIQERGYVQKNEKRQLVPSEIGFLVNDMLVKHFPQIVDIQFTAKMEENLDDIAEGKIAWRGVLREFYDPFAKNLEEKYEEVEKQNMTQETKDICEKCGKPMVIRMGRFGKFMACSGFPECKNTKKINNPAKNTGIKCPDCRQGDVIIKKTKRGRIFFGCSRYPDCKYASWQDPRREMPPPDKT